MISFSHLFFFIYLSAAVHLCFNCLECFNLSVLCCVCVCVCIACFQPCPFYFFVLCLAFLTAVQSRAFRPQRADPVYILCDSVCLCVCVCMRDVISRPSLCVLFLYNE